MRVASSTSLASLTAAPASSSAKSRIRMSSRSASHTPMTRPPRRTTGAIHPAAWLTAGAAHHTVMSTAVGIEAFRDFAEMMQMELLVIDEDTTLPRFQESVRWNAAYHRLARGI